ncbi:hypothetical protein HAX54_030748 [Datura stramonium]|uniref:Uncharacterized protein n=1 Tax=Datura stramonium TaxID=4076 RepID=A0ABS8V860_DATST|nr:hypothetical protein [Datura stramonium]
MTQKFNKGKGVSSSCHGNKRSRETQDAPMEDESMPKQSLRHYGIHWLMEKHVNHVPRERVCLVFALITGRPVNVGVIIKDVLRRERKGLDLTKTKEIKGIQGLVLSISERNVLIHNALSHLYDMQVLQLRMSGVMEEKLWQLNMDYPSSEHLRSLCSIGPNLEEPFDDDDATNDKPTGAMACYAQARSTHGVARHTSIPTRQEAQHTGNVKATKNAIPIQVGTEVAKSNPSRRRNNEDLIYGSPMILSTVSC